MTKICSKCKTERPRSEFHNNKRSPDGKMYACKPCEKAKKALFYVENRERILARTTAYVKENADKVKAYHANRYLEKRDHILSLSKSYFYANKDRIAERHREWHKNNAELVSARHVRNYRACPEKHKRTCAEYYRKNVGRYRARDENRRARELGAEGFFTQADVEAIFNRQQGRCVYCHCDISSGYHRDHIISLFMGGSNWPYNLQLTCPACNRSKGKKSHNDFVRYRVRLGLYVAPDLMPEDILV